LITKYFLEAVLSEEEVNTNTYPNSFLSRKDPSCESKCTCRLLLLPGGRQLPFLQIVFPSAVFIIIAMFLQEGDKTVYLGGCTLKLVSLAGLFSRKGNSVH